MCVLGSKAGPLQPVFPAGRHLVRRQFQVHWSRTTEDNIVVITMWLHTDVAAQAFHDGSQFVSFLLIAGVRCFPFREGVRQDFV